MIMNGLIFFQDADIYEFDEDTPHLDSHLDSQDVELTMAASSEDTAGTSQGRYTGVGPLPLPTIVTDERYLCVSSYILNYIFG